MPRTPPLKRRYLCLWLPAFATDRMIRARPDLAGRPVVLITSQQGRPVISALNNDAGRAGARLGQPLANARAAAGELTALPHEFEADHDGLKALGQWCIQFTPRVACEDSDNLILDITGCAHLVGGEQALCELIRDRLYAMGFTVRLAIAGTVGLSWALAHFGDRQIERHCGNMRAAIAQLPVHALRLPAVTVGRLAEFGLHRIEELNRLKRKEIASRFGLGLIRRLDQICGDADEPLSIIAEATQRLSQYRFIEPARWENSIRLATQELLRDLCAQEEAAGTGLRRVRLMGYCVDGEITGFTIGTHRPSRDPDHLYRLMNDQFSKLEAGFGIELLCLRAEESGPFEEQTRPLKGHGAQSSDPDLSALMDNLSARFGSNAVSRAAARESWIPERAETRQPFGAQKTVPPARHPAQWPHHAPRPVLLFTPPEPLYHADLELRRFTWRHQQYNVSQMSGPERITSEWWKGETGLRDYYAVEVAQGARLWIFLRPDLDPPRWFIHGLLA